ncbi:MAG: type II secretion system protein GspG [Verrucomicrobiota bacterium]
MKLLEMLVVLAIISSVSITQIQNHDEMVEKANDSLARYQLVQIGKALMMEKTLGILPSEEGFSNWINAHTMKIEGDRSAADPWGTPIRYSLRDKKHFSLTSAGVDQMFDTEDDIVFR